MPNKRSLATQQGALDLVLPTDVDLSAAQNCFAKQDANNHAVLAGAGDIAIGILQDATNGSVKQGLSTVRVQGIAKVVAGGSITVNAFLKSDASGHAVVITADKDAVNALSLSNAVVSDLVEVLICHFQASI